MAAYRSSAVSPIGLFAKVYCSPSKDIFSMIGLMRFSASSSTNSPVPLERNAVTAVPAVSFLMIFPMAPLNVSFNFALRLNPFVSLPKIPNAFSVAVETAAVVMKATKKAPEGAYVIRCIHHLLLQ